MIIYQGKLNSHNQLKPYSKIISLVPSITWMLFDLKLDPKIAGITKFCKAPNDLHVPYLKLGGTKNPDLNKIISLKPDLVIANKEENRKEDIEILAEKFDVYLSDVVDMESMYVMIEEISTTTQSNKLGTTFINQIQNAHQSYLSHSRFNTKQNVVYVIWKAPYMTVGSDTFIHYMLELAGFKNCFSDLLRYPELTKDELFSKKPDWVFLSSEPYPFTIKHLDEFKPLNTRLVDGQIFSWYGTFILQSFDYLNAFKKNLSSLK